MTVPPSRLRILLLPPLNERKCLVPIPNTVETITDLKRHLINVVPGIYGLTNDTQDLCLEINGFEICDGPLTALREDDMIG